LSVVGTIDKSTRVWAQVLVAVISVSSAIAASVPRVKQYGEMAGHARQLCTTYGKVEGELLNAYECPPAQRSEAVLQKVITNFDAVKSLKDANLRDLPPRPIVKSSKPDEGWPPDTYFSARKLSRDCRHRYARVRLPWWPKPET
jgi:hypothetical protein